MAVRCVQLVLVLGFVPADAGLFLFPALPTPTDFKGAGQSMAEEMQKVWFAIAGSGQLCHAWMRYVGPVIACKCGAGEAVGALSRPTEGRRAAERGPR